MTEWHEVTDSQLLRHWQVDGMSTAEICARYGVEYPVVRDRLVGLGETVTNGRRGWKAKLAAEFSEDEFRQVLAHMRPFVFAQQYGFPHRTVALRAKELGIPSRPLGRPHGSRDSYNRRSTRRASDETTRQANTTGGGTNR